MNRPGSSSSARPRVGLVLAGGGISGYGFHTGALHALAETTGWEPSTADIIVGTSSGSIAAALLRAGLTPGDMRARVLATGPGAETEEMLSSLVGFEVFEWPQPRWGADAYSMVTAELGRPLRGESLRAGHVLIGLLPEGRVSTEPLRSLIEPLHPDGWPDRRLWIPVTDEQSGERVVFGRYPSSAPDVATAVQASCAIPGYFAPVEHDGRRYIDGGVGAADNADLLVGQDLDVVVICSPMSIDAFELPLSPVTSALRVYPRRKLGVSVQALEDDGTVTIVLEPDRALGATMGWTAMARRRLRRVVEASEIHVADQLAAMPEERLRALGHHGI